MDACQLWVSLGSGRRHRGEPRPSTFLRFIRTGLLVGLPDEPGGLLTDAGALKQFRMRRVDAEGLGLTADDFAEGVAICAEDLIAGGIGWHCERVQLMIGAEERIEALAPRFQPQGTATATGSAAAPPASARSAPPARPRRILAVVDADGDDHATVDEAAALAREHSAALLLVATGELAETSRHAAEERAALSARLEALAAPLHDLTVHCRVEMGGDPVRDILAVADGEGVDLILTPARHSRFADAVEPRMAAALARRTSVPVRAVSEADAARAGAVERMLVDEVRVAIPALPHSHAGDTWDAVVRGSTSSAFRHAVFGSGALALAARWYTVAGGTVDHLALARVIDAVTAEPAWPTGVAPHVARLTSEVITVTDRGEERLEVDIRSA